jgi:chromosome segregation ATPase
MGSEERAENLEKAHNSARPQGEEELFGVIADVERQLATLKTHRTEREEFRSRLESREKELDQRVRDLAAKEASLQELATAHKAEQERIAARVREVEAAEGELGRRREKLEKDFGVLAEEQRRASEAAAKEAAEVKAMSVALEQRENRLAEHAASISRQREAFETTAAQLAKREEAAVAAAAELEKTRKVSTELKTRLEESERQAASRIAELDQVTKRAMELERRSADLTRQAEESRKQFEEQSLKLAEQLRIAKDEVKRAGEAQSALMAEIAKHDKAAEEARKESETVKAEAGRRQTALTESEARVADFKRQVIDRDSRIQDLSGKLAAATTKFREVSQSLQGQASLAEQAQNLAEELKDRDRKIADLKAAASRADSGAAKADMEALEEQLQQMREQLQESKNTCRALKAQLAQGGGDERAAGAIPEDVGEAVMTRWRRLRLMRSLLQEQGERLRAASEAIRERYAQAEQLLSQRDQLAQARAAIATAREKLERLQSRAAVGKVAVGLFYLVGAFAALAGLSWVMAGQIAPATYVARTVVNADTKGQQISDDQLAEWKKYLDSQLKDPRMMELAADRMTRAGIVSLGTPGQLSQRLETDLVSDSAVPGSLKFELRGSGKAATIRVLDTFITALVSQANATKERRTDGLGVLIAEKPNADAGPMESSRALYSAIIFGAGLCLCLGFGSVTYSKLSKAKVRIEEEQRIDEILENQSWAEAEKQLRDRRG